MCFFPYKANKKKILNIWHAKYFSVTAKWWGAEHTKMHQNQQQKKLKPSVKDQKKEKLPVNLQYKIVERCFR